MNQDGARKYRETLKRLGHIRRQLSGLSGDDFPTPGSVYVYVDDAQHTADRLSFDGGAPGPQASGHRSVLEKADLNVACVEGLIRDRGVLHDIDHLVLVNRLTVRECAAEIIGVHTSEKCAIVELNGARRLPLEDDDLLPLHFWVGRHFILRARKGSKRQPNSQQHDELIHAVKPPQRVLAFSQSPTEKVYGCSTGFS